MVAIIIFQLPNLGLWEWIGYDGLEGQRPHLTHFSTTGGAEIAFRQHSGELTTEDTESTE
jgi:hypothetical protein